MKEGDAISVSPRERLTDELRALIRAQKAVILAALNPTPQDPDSWRPLFIAYDIHASKCPTCIAGGLDYGLRCGVGASLWTNYQNTESQK
jgi:hypothetical protein